MDFGPRRPVGNRQHRRVTATTTRGVERAERKQTPCGLGGERIRFGVLIHNASHSRPSDDAEQDEKRGGNGDQHAEQVGRDGVVEYSARLPDGGTVTVDSNLDDAVMKRVLDSLYVRVVSEGS